MNDGTATEAETRETATDADDSQGAEKKFTDVDMKNARESWKKRYLAPLKTRLDAAEAAQSEFFTAHDVDSYDDIAERLTVQAQVDGDHAELQRTLTKSQRELTKAVKERDEVTTVLGKMVSQRNAAAVKDSIFEAAAKAGSFEHDVYARLVVANQVAVDEEGAVFVRGTDGEPAHGVSVGQLVTQLVADNKHLQRPTAAQGGGSLPAASSSTSSGPDFATDRNARIEVLRAAGLGKRQRQG